MWLDTVFLVWVWKERDLAHSFVRCRFRDIKRVTSVFMLGDEGRIYEYDASL